MQRWGVLILKKFKCTWASCILFPWTTTPPPGQPVWKEVRTGAPKCYWRAGFPSAVRGLRGQVRVGPSPPAERQCCAPLSTDTPRSGSPRAPLLLPSLLRGHPQVHCAPNGPCFFFLHQGPLPWGPSWGRGGRRSANTLLWVELFLLERHTEALTPAPVNVACCGNRVRKVGSPSARAFTKGDTQTQGDGGRPWGRVATSPGAPGTTRSRKTLPQSLWQRWGLPTP